jgi:CHAD domain-containing protein
MLPDTMRDDLASFFARLRTERKQAWTDMVELLNSAAYASTLGEWEAFLNEPALDDPVAPNASRPIVGLARHRIYKRYRQIIKEGHQLVNHAPDALLHALRIDCKKLRYLLEFFANLFPREQIDVLIGQLKALQSVLGDFNDLSVQQAYLLRTADTLPSIGADNRKELVAIGFLVGRMTDDKNAIRARLARTFGEFASRPNREVFRHLFKDQQTRPVNGTSRTVEQAWRHYE